MKVLICGMDGYLGWPLALKLAIGEGAEVVGVDNYSRRSLVHDAGSDSAIPIAPMRDRLLACRDTYGTAPQFYEGDMRDYGFVSRMLEEQQPDGIVHLGEMPSAPFSMSTAGRAYFTQENNVLGTLNLLHAMRDHVPQAHLVKLGTMGEYGTPNIDIPEGFFDVEYNGRRDELPFPRQAGSFYHLSKVHDSLNVMFACRVWGLTSTDIMQGVVYGTRTDEIRGNSDLATRFDFDEMFGTAINRYCAQAVIGHDLTVYGSGHQKRGFLALRDSMQCLTIALRSPPAEGEYRVFNQFDEVYDLTALAETVAEAAQELDLNPRVKSFTNPRVEAESHYYNPVSEKLRNLGFRPTKTLREELTIMFKDLLHHKEVIQKYRDAIAPRTLWRPQRPRVFASPGK